MALTIKSRRQDVDTAPDGYNSKSFRLMLESHLEYIRRHAETSFLEMEGNDYLRFKGDLDGWLLKQKVHPNYHWVIGRLNGYHASTDYTGKQRRFLVPSKGLIDQLLQMHRTATTVL